MTNECIGSLSPVRNERKGERVGVRGNVLQETASDMPNVFHMEIPDMNESTLTEEQQIQVKKLLARLHRQRVVAAYAYASFILGMLLFFRLIFPPSSLYGCLPIFIINGFGAYKAFRWATKRFVRQLAPTERNLLNKAADIPLSSREKYEHKELVEVFQQIPPQAQYLRASQKPQNDDTLLRAAQYTNETAQEQLLRPTDNA